MVFHNLVELRIAENLLLSISTPYLKELSPIPYLFAPDR